ncbi:MAG TPA: FHA domain-containing protein, partial [Thermodesulfobacteriota bacterium]|nr:FHA domain-containing protein [Thermodesulfobacteriota bacterium]
MDLGLAWQGGDALHEVVLTPGGPVRVGRGPAVDLAVDHPGVSRLHALLWPADDTWEVADAGSRNGTTVNGRPAAARTPLAAGDRIGLGPVVLTVTGLLARGHPQPAALRDRLLARL